MARADETNRAGDRWRKMVALCLSFTALWIVVAVELRRVRVPVWLCIIVGFSASLIAAYFFRGLELIFSG